MPHSSHSLTLGCAFILILLSTPTQQDYNSSRTKPNHPSELVLVFLTGIFPGQKVAGQKRPVFLVFKDAVRSLAPRDKAIHTPF